MPLAPFLTQTPRELSLFSCSTNKPRRLSYSTRTLCVLSIHRVHRQAAWHGQRQPGGAAATPLWVLISCSIVGCLPSGCMSPLRSRIAESAAMLSGGRWSQTLPTAVPPDSAACVDICVSPFLTR